MSEKTLEALLSVTNDFNEAVAILGGWQGLSEIDRKYFVKYFITDISCGLCKYIDIDDENDLVNISNSIKEIPAEIFNNVMTVLILEPSNRNSPHVLAHAPRFLQERYFDIHPVGYDGFLEDLMPCYWDTLPLEYKDLAILVTEKYPDEVYDYYYNAERRIPMEVFKKIIEKSPERLLESVLCHLMTEYEISLSNIFENSYKRPKSRGVIETLLEYDLRKLIWDIIKKNGNLIKWIVTPPEDLQMLAVEQDPVNIFNIDIPCEAAQDYAEKHLPREVFVRLGIQKFGMHPLLDSNYYSWSEEDCEYSDTIAVLNAKQQFKRPDLTEEALELLLGKHLK